MNTKNNNRKGGFALSEVLLSITIIVIIGIVVYPLYTNARRQAKIEQIKNVVTALMANSDENRITYRHGATTSVFSVLDYLKNTGGLPDHMTDEGPSPWGGDFYSIVDMEAQMAYLFLPDGRSNMIIELYNSEQPECVDLFKTLAPLTQGQLDLSNGTNPYYYVSGQQIDTSALVNACAVDPYGTATYTFIFDSDASISYH